MSRKKINVFPNENHHVPSLKPTPQDRLETGDFHLKIKEKKTAARGQSVPLTKKTAGRVFQKKNPHVIKKNQPIRIFRETDFDELSQCFFCLIKLNRVSP